MTIHTDISIDEYHRGSHGFYSHSKLRCFSEESPFQFHAVHVAKTWVEPETNDLRFGSAFETLFQEGGDVFAQRVQIIDGDGRNSEVKKKRAACVAAGKRWVTNDEYMLMVDMTRSLDKHAKGVAYTRDASQQITLRGELCGLPMQCRPDWLQLDAFLSTSVDLKTTRDLKRLAEPRGWGLRQYGYHSQAALVRELLRQNGYEHVVLYNWAVDKNPPSHKRALIEIRPDLLDEGLRYLEATARELKHCLETDTWPQGPEEPIKIGDKWSDHPADNDSIHVSDTDAAQ